MRKEIPDYDYLIKYCADRGWFVEEVDKSLDCSVEENGNIKIGKLLKKDLKLFSLLHEIGHLLVWENEYDKKYPGYSKNVKHKHYQVAVVEEEIKAWDAGLEIAEDLGLWIDLKKWHAHRYDCIHGYIRLCRKPKRFEKQMG